MCALLLVIKYIVLFTLTNMEDIILHWVSAIKSSFLSIYKYQFIYESVLKVYIVCKIADVSSQPESPQQVTTPPMQPDELELLMNSALLQLRKLPYEIRMDLAINFIQNVHCTVVEHMQTNSTS